MTFSFYLLGTIQFFLCLHWFLRVEGLVTGTLPMPGCIVSLIITLLSSAFFFSRGAAQV